MNLTVYTSKILRLAELTCFLTLQIQKRQITPTNIITVTHTLTVIAIRTSLSEFGCGVEVDDGSSARVKVTLFLTESNKTAHSLFKLVFFS